MMNIAINLSKSIKVKVAVFFGYKGSNYLGMQYQRDLPNKIQNTIHKTLCDENFVLKTNMSSLKRIKWSRAARTDKTVHALCNAISVRLEFDGRYVRERQSREIQLDKAVADINAKLPQDIRVFAMKRVGKAFDVRYNACSRVYNYVCPANMFFSKQDFAGGKQMSGVELDELVARVNQLASTYLGTHSFHNFSKGYKNSDPSSARYIIGISVQKLPQEVVNKCLQQQFQGQQKMKNKVDFLRFTVIGQSFIYHQIRKMIGLLIKICHEQLEQKQTFQNAFGKDKYEMYLAPAEGLYLNGVTFTTYNSKKEQQHLRISLTEQQKSRISNYRGYLQSNIILLQLQQKRFSNWLQLQDKWAQAQQLQGKTNQTD